jgi:hypothetical protein
MDDDHVAEEWPAFYTVQLGQLKAVKKGEGRRHVPNNGKIVATWRNDSKMKQKKP